VHRFLPTSERVENARIKLAEGHYCDLGDLMGVTDLAWPRPEDVPALIEEFGNLVDECGLRSEDSTGFIVLIPVAVNGSTFTTPVFVDVTHGELAFTSHPEFGAGRIPDDVLAENPDLPSALREELLGVLATWHNTALAEDEV
jgi:hypothetical protein